MGYIVSLALLIVGLVTRDPQVMIAAGMFGISGAIEIFGIREGKRNE